MKKYFQTFCKSLGNYACYLFCIINIAEEYLKKSFSYDELFDIIEKSFSQGYVRFNFDDYNDINNFYVNEPCKILYMITGKSWKVKKTYDTPKEKYYIECWSAVEGVCHFARTYVGYNSLQHSNSVENGKIISYRVFTCDPQQNR